MKNLFVRTITGTVYVAAIIGCIVAGRYFAFALFAMVLIITVYEFFKMCLKKNITPQVVPNIIISVFIYALFFLTENNIIDDKFRIILIPLGLVVPVIEIFRQKQNPVQNIAFTLLAIIYFALPLSIFNMALTPYASQPEIYKPEILIGLFVIIWLNDTGAYLVGSLLGKHKMAEKISPNKTWEGTFGGALLGMIVSLIFFRYFEYFNTIQIIIIALAVIVAGTFGDLTESLIKRNFEVKDSGTLLPGHGGFFDRFDSLLFAAPVYYALISLFLK